MTFFDGSIDVVVAGALFAAGALSRRFARKPMPVTPKCASIADGYHNSRCEALADPHCVGGSCRAHCKKHCGKRCGDE